MISTTTLETSKLLKENGFRQDTYFCWITEPEYVPETQTTEYIPKLYLNKDSWDQFGLECSAPTTDELLSELPEHIPSGHRLVILKIGKEMCAAYQALIPMQGLFTKVEFLNESLPEALAQMWLHLRREGIV